MREDMNKSAHWSLRITRRARDYVYLILEQKFIAVWLISWSDESMIHDINDKCSALENKNSDDNS